MRFEFLVLAACMVFVLGCPQPVGVMDGVRINSFGFDSSTISDKEEVELSLEVENVGAFDTNVDFHIYGYDDTMWESVAGDGARLWSVNNLRGYNMDAKASGMTKYFNGVFKMKDLVPKGITERYTFYGRLCYDYETRANAMIKAVSASQRRDDKKKSAFSQNTINMQNSYAPIQIELKTKSPIVFYKSDGEDAVGSKQRVEFALIIRNVAGGYPASGGCSESPGVSDINKLSGLEVSLDGDKFTFSDDEKYDSRCTPILSLYDGEGVVYCVYSLEEGSQPKGEYLLSVVAKYNYYVDRSVSISVVGSEDV